MVAANGMDTAPVVEECVYVDYANAAQGACGATVAANATGVRVRVRETHDTHFIRLIPGAPETVTVSAEATAHVQRFSGSLGDAPFIICGFNAWDVTEQSERQGKQRRRELRHPGNSVAADDRRGGNRADLPGA